MLKRSAGIGYTISRKMAILAIFLFSFLSFATIGSGLVIAAWLASENGSIRLVGQLFFLSSLTSLLCSIYAGAIVDRHSRISVVRWGQTMRLAGVSILAVGTLFSDWLVLSLFAYTFLVTVGTSLNAGALDGIFQSAVPEPLRVIVAVRVSIARQLGIVAGTGLGGWLLHSFPTFVSATLMIGLVLLQCIIVEMVFSRYAHAPVITKQRLLAFWADGIRSVWKNPPLTVSIVAVALLFSVSQMTNVLVPGFVRDTLHRGSDVYGLLETAWAAGGGVTLALAAIRSRSFSGGGREFIMLSLIGVLMIAFAFSRMVPILVALYASLGALFSLSRAICDGRILALARSEEIGRVRAAASMLTSLLGMMIYISPTVLGSDNTVQYYCVWGTVVSLCGAAMYLIACKAMQESKAIS